MNIPENIKSQYKEWGISEDELKWYNKKLAMPVDKLNARALMKRELALKEAVGLPSGPDQENRKVTIIYNIRGFEIGVAKPGKEAAPDYQGVKHYKTGVRGNNINDMLPLVLKEGKPFGKNLTFQEFFEAIEKLMHDDLFGLEVISMLLFRCAYMMDHEINGQLVRYKPDREVIDRLTKRIPEIGGLPTEAFLHHLEILGLNEDAKVTTLGHNIKDDYGRPNTLRTISHLISVLLLRSSLSKFAGQFARPPSGMAPINKSAKHIYPLLPLLNPDLGSFDDSAINK